MCRACSLRQCWHLCSAGIFVNFIVFRHKNVHFNSEQTVRHIQEKPLGAQMLKQGDLLWGDLQVFFCAIFSCGKCPHIELVPAVGCGIRLIVFPKKQIATCVAFFLSATALSAGCESPNLIRWAE